MVRIGGLSRTIGAIRGVCKVLNVTSPVIRQFVPEGQRALYDQRIDGIHQACTLFMSLDWLDSDDATTNALAK